MKGLSDLELSEKAKTAMQEHRYDDAIGYLRLIGNQVVSLKMEVLVIEHEVSHKRELEKQAA